MRVELQAEIRAHAVQRHLQPLAEIKNIVAVASGKGGVGKSTVAVNLALAWAAQGARVGILDADIYGPSQPLMLGLAGSARLPGRQAPEAARGPRHRAMSIGFLVDAEQPMVWRGPMVTQALTQLLSETDWGASTTSWWTCRRAPATSSSPSRSACRSPGRVIVTTPQDIALADARKGLKMFEKVSVPVLGIVENMSVHVCSQCGHVEHVFGAGGGARMAAAVRRAAPGRAAARCAHPRRGRRRPSDRRRRAGFAARAAPICTWRAARRRRLRARARDRSSVFPKIVVEDS